MNRKELESNLAAIEDIGPRKARLICEKLITLGFSLVPVEPNGHWVNQIRLVQGVGLHEARTYINKTMAAAPDTLRT